MTNRKNIAPGIHTLFIILVFTNGQSGLLLQDRKSICLDNSCWFLIPFHLILLTFLNTCHAVVSLSFCQSGLDLILEEYVHRDDKCGNTVIISSLYHGTPPVTVSIYQSTWTTPDQKNISKKKHQVPGCFLSKAKPDEGSNQSPGISQAVFLT